jgi:predicted nucleic acid-binding protein
VIYVDTSVVLARLLAEDKRPPEELWVGSLVSSRLVVYETWVRLSALGLVASHGEAAHAILARLALAELAPQVLARALEPFPMPVRTLDALHLSTLHFLHQRLGSVALASYDQRMAEAARRMGFAIQPL